MANAAPTLATSIELRAQSYLRFALILSGLNAVLTFATDFTVAGWNPELAMFRAAEFSLLAVGFFFGWRNPKWHRPVVFVTMGWWCFADTLANQYTNSQDITIMMAALIMAAEGVFAEGILPAILRALLHTTLVILALYIGGTAFDERIWMLLGVGAVAGVILSVSANHAEERSVAVQIQAWEAQRDAERAAEARVDFLGRMSHELRTPLNGVLGMLQLIQDDGPLNADQQSDVRVAYQSGTQLLTLVTDILDFSAMTTGRSQASPAPTRLHPLLQDRAEQLREAVPELRIDLMTSSLPAGLMVDGPRDMRVVDVLLDNAAKFTHRGNIRIQVNFQEDCLEVEVMDTGVGLPEDHSRLFDAFEQGDGTRTRRYGGAGLGLAISKHLAESMGGTLSARDRMGHGSIFTLRIPASICTPPPLAEGSGKRLKGHMLIVEDNPINQMVLKGLLQTLGLTSSTCENGEEALVCAENQHFDAILMDFHMPVMDGMEATRRLRAMGLDVPIIGVSASVMPQDKRAALASGMDHTLGKPVERSVLQQTLADYLPTAAISRHTSVA